MAHEDDDTTPAATEPPATAGKPTAAAKGGHGSWFQGKHRDAIIVGCSLLGVIIAFMSLRKSSTPATTATAAAGTGYLTPTTAAQSGLASAGAVGGYNASAYQGLQTLLANQSDQLGTLESAVTNLTGAGSTTPTAIASSLTSPTYNGQYVHIGSGLGEVEADKSLFIFSPSQWATALRNDPNAPANVTDLGNTIPQGMKLYSTAGNITAANAPAAGA